MDREPAVAGRFYPAEHDVLASQVASLLGEIPNGHATPEPLRPTLGLLAPHAGYMYSGAVAGAAYARADIPERAVVIGPNHTARGARIALWPDGGWATPLGRVPVDPALTLALLSPPLVTADREAHLLEHSLEVQLPFLMMRRRDIAVAALCVSQLSYAECEDLGHLVAQAAAGKNRALVVASSDMSHYVSASEAREKDRRALDRLLALDPKGLYDIVNRERISMCGYIPATVMLVAVLELGARKAELVRYGHSGEVSGESHSVVGYAGALVY